MSLECMLYALQRKVSGERGVQLVVVAVPVGIFVVPPDLN